MSAFIDLTGQKFGRLVVIEQAGKDKQGRYRWLSECDCGNKIVTNGYYLRCGDTKSCGCLNIEKTIERSTNHGHKTREKTSEIYEAWKGMIQRCTNPKNKAYHNYGGRGITVCNRWLHSFENFNEDKGKDWKPGLTIERKDNEGNYEPENVEWIPREQQQRNTRRNRLITCFGKTKCLAAWAEEYNIPYGTLLARIDRLGWSTEKALTTPVRKKKGGL